ncbi:MAG: T9SS type A sorting domain-containing protein [Flavobacterium sp.]|nr:T9SS type A sorting domain-containing protein [Flavobacterium sp.]
MKKLLLLILLCFAIASAQPGSVDMTFNSSDSGYGNGIGGFGKSIDKIILLPDGKILMAGSFDAFLGTARNHILRLNADGSLDMTFDPGMGATGTGANILALTLQSDGKILIGGFFTAYNGIARNNIARLNPDGTLDTTFDPGIGTDQVVNAIEVQPNGKIIIGGDFSTYNGTPRVNVARLNTDASLDTEFDPLVGTNNSISCMIVRSDGKILIAGSFTTFNNIERDRIALLNADGTLDITSSFGVGAGGTIEAMTMQSDGKILIVGYFTTYNNTLINRVARINPDGSIDAAFNTGNGAHGVVSSVTVQADGKILIGGYFDTYNEIISNNMARLNPDGSLDATFNSGSGVEIITSTVKTTAVRPDGKILIGGNFRVYNGITRNYLALLNADGVLDTTFTAGTSVGNNVNSIAMQTDGMMVVGGDFYSYDDISRNNIARLTSDGTLDTTFNPGTGANDVINCVAVQTDGKILIGGDFTAYNGTSTNHIARLNADGTPDFGFNAGIGANSAVETFTLQSDGKIVIGGTFTSYNGTSINRIARLNANGTLDTGFNVGTGANNAVFSIKMQPDGKILVGGAFTAYNNFMRNRIIRLDANGSLDTTFNTGTGASNFVNVVAMQTDGKILIGGTFITFNSTAMNRVARLNSDGSLDSSFGIGTGSNSAIRNILATPAGKILVGGSFSSFNGGTARCFAQLNNDGSTDTSFQNPFGTDGTVTDIALQADGKLLVAGNFASYNQIGRNHLTRILTSESLDISDYEKTVMSFYPNPAKDIITFTTPLSALEVFTLEGKRVDAHYANNTLGILNLTNGIYILRGQSTDGKSFTLKMLKQ